MERKSLNRDQVKRMMTYDRSEFFSSPMDFDCPPPNFEKADELGWTLLAKAIVASNGGLARYIDYAKRWK